MRLSKKQIVRPSGIVQSVDGRYFFWECVVTKTKTFANEKRFLKLVTRYGSEEALFKTFICKAASCSEVEPKKEPKVEVEVAAVKVEVEVAAVKVEEAPQYPWQKDANYFGGGKITSIPVSVEEVTKDVCMYPPSYLDNMCAGCPVYDKCKLVSKYQPADWANAEKRDARKVKVRQLVYEKAE